MTSGGLIRRRGFRYRMAMTSLEPIHVIGGGLAGSEAAWQIASAGVPVVLHEMRPGARHRRAQDRRPRRTRLLQLLPLGRRRGQRGRPAAPGDAAARLAHHAQRRRPSGAGRRRAGGRPRRLLGGGDGGARGASAGRRSSASEIAGLPPAEWDSVIVATGPLTSPALAEAIRALTGEERARVLRRHRADRLSRIDRHGRGLVPVALRQGRAGRHGRGLHQLPARHASNTRPSSTRWSPATRPTSRNGKRRRPISTAACRSR